MSAALDELAPVDDLVVEFPAGHTNLTGEMAGELGQLVQSDTIRVLDLLTLTDDESGVVDALEIDDLGQVDALRVAETQLAEILAADDAAHLGEAMEPGTTAGVLVWENRRAAQTHITEAPGPEPGGNEDGTR